MTAPIPLNATSQANQPASSERGIDRLFGEMAAMYGSKFADLWAGTDIEHVKAKWVEKLKPFAAHPGVVQAALKALDYHPNPPTCPTFVSLCRDAMRHVDTSPVALPYKPTPEDEERARNAAASAAKVVKKFNADGTDAHWATHPRSVAQMRMIMDASRRDPRFLPCVAEMVAKGICTEDGHLLKTYRDQQWFPVLSRAA